MPSDEQIQSQIEAMDSERERLWKEEAASDGAETHANRIRELEVDLDRCWDLLRQRRALREAGSNPDLASERSAEIVEKYWQ